jgi:nitroreductase
MNSTVHADDPAHAHALPDRSTVRGTAEDLDELCEAACTLIGSRRNVSPKRLVEPGPSEAQLECIFGAAAAAPDHDRLTPWRFVVVPQHKRELLAEVFALALVERDPGATLVQIEAAREKAHRAPLLMLAVVRLPSPAEPEIPAEERIVSLGCAVQNMLLMAHAMGYGSGLTSGQAMASPRLRALFRLADNEAPVCFVNFGTVTNSKPGRIRPQPAQFISNL